MIWINFYQTDVVLLLLHLFFFFFSWKDYCYNGVDTICHIIVHLELSKHKCDSRNCMECHWKPSICWFLYMIIASACCCINQHAREPLCTAICCRYQGSLTSDDSLEQGWTCEACRRNVQSKCTRSVNANGAER